VLWQTARMSLEGAWAALLVVSVLLACHGLALRCLPGEGAALRGAAAIVLGVSGAWIVFQVLAAFGLFRIDVAGPLVVLTAALVLRATGIGGRALLAALGRDLAAAAAVVLGSGTWGLRTLRALGTAIAASVCVRALILPPLGWDSLTYHAVKSALWVQSGGGLPLELPGGWSFYRHYPPGGEILGAWAMLPFHDDTLYLWVDGAIWLAWAPILLSILRELPVPERLRLPACLYLMTLPAVYFWIGSGYVDVGLDVLASAGLLFTLRATRGEQPRLSSALALLAFCGCVTIKITAIGLPLLAVAVIGVAAPGRRAAMRGCGLGLALGAAIVAPVWIRNLVEQGHPLSPYDVELFGLVLGRMPASLAWYGEWSPADWSFGRELVSLATVLGLAGHPGSPHFGPLGAAVMVLAGLGAARRRREAPAAVGLLLGVCATQLVFYLSPGFTGVRLLWSHANARLLGVGYLACLLLATMALRRERSVRLAAWALVAASTWSVGTALVRFPSRLETAPLCVGIVWGTLGGLALHAAARRLTPERLAVGVLALGVLGAVLGTLPLQRLRASLRYAVIGDSVVAHDVAANLARLAEYVDLPGESREIAVTVGPHKLADRAYLYGLLGSKLQNHLHFVPVTRDGTPVEYSGPDPVPLDALDATIWTDRIADRGITDVVVFPPAWHELAWMEARPDRFRFVAGARGRFGVYRVLAPAADPGLGARAAPGRIPRDAAP